MSWGGLARRQHARAGGKHAMARPAAAREAQPTAGIIDSQSVKITESCGVSGHDAGKRIMGRERHIDTDTTGLQVGLEIHSASIQDRDGGAGCAEIRRRAISDAAPHLRGRRICGARIAGCPEGHRALERPDRQTLRHHRGLRDPAPLPGR